MSSDEKSRGITEDGLAGTSSADEVAAKSLLMTSLTALRGAEDGPSSGGVSDMLSTLLILTMLDVQW